MRGAALIVLAWNKWALTERCLASLLASDLDGAEVIVVDNGSGDDTPRGLVAFADRVRIVSLPENLGFVRGMNAGIAAARADDDVVLLNNDLAFTQRDWLGRLRDAAYSEPEFGIVGCRMLGPEPEGRLYHDGSFIEPDRLWGQQTESGLIERDIAQYTRTRRVQGIAFALAYIRRDALARIGGLDLAYHSYFEDTDYCLSASEIGIATAFAGAVTLRHDQHGSTTDDSTFRSGLFAQSRATFAARWQRKLADAYRGTVLWQSMTRGAPPFSGFARDYVRRLDALGLRATFASLRNELADPQDFRLELAADRSWNGTPDAALVAAPAPDFVRAHGRFRVGLGIAAWDRVPDDWARAANTLDRLVVPDAFQAEAFRASGVERPIAVVPLGIDRDYFHPRVVAPRHPRGHFVFLALADDLVRDAPDVLIETFLRTFREDEPVELLVRTTARIDANLAATLAALVANAGGRVRLLQAWAFAHHERAQLIAACDAYVSVRRGGGHDPHASEALACGRLLVASDFGSQRALVREYGLAVESTPIDDPSQRGSRWSEPDRDALAARLREAFERKDVLMAEALARAESFAAAHDIDDSAARLVSELAHGGTFKPARALPKAHRPAGHARASGQLIVLGMHRSGTSSVAGLLARMGVWPGDRDALLAGPDNPRGHYELAEFHGACLRRLAAAGGDWKHPSAGAPPDAVDAFRRETAAILDTLDAHRPWLIKEPRLCLVVRELLPLLTRPVFVHVVRDPLAVAASLAARDAMSTGNALALWERYTREAFAATRGWLRIIVDYDALIADPHRTTARLYDELAAFGVEGLVAPSRAVVDEWIERDSRSAPSSRDAGALTPPQRALLDAITDRRVLDADFDPLAAPNAPCPAATTRAAG